MNHFKHKLTSPLISIAGGYAFIFVLAIFLYSEDFYESSTLFTWGVPVTFMGKKIEDEVSYYLLLLLVFVHQLINNWVNDVTYPWIINCVQDPKCTSIGYSNPVAMLIVLLFVVYSELDMIIIISGAMSQISFFLVLIFANICSAGIINWRYLKDKTDFQDITVNIYN